MHWIRLTAALLALTAIHGVMPLHAQQVAPAESHPRPPTSAPTPAPSDAKKGLVLNSADAFAGYTLFAPMMSTKTYLIDMRGEVAHMWTSRYEPGQSVYLLDDGSLLRTGREPDNRHFGGGGIGGRIERLVPDSTVLWEYDCADESRCQHHDIEPLPNGNVLLIAWEKKTRDDALAAGRDPDEVSRAGMWPDCILEIEPHDDGGKVVWEWHAWDHLVQEFDQDKPNYGVVARHPELIDLNYRRVAPRETPEEMDRLRALGYVGGDEPDEPESDASNGGSDRDAPEGFPGGHGMQPDWCHTNAVAYNPQLDQIALSVHTFNEIWIIDHSTTAAEAASHAGGRQGQGGDLLYRWGNPRAHDAGGETDQQLFAQHDVRWIPEGMPGAGRLMVFNNGTGRPGEPYSSIIEIDPPVDANGRYARPSTGGSFAPDKPGWEYVADTKTDFFAGHISGAERLPNGDTLICSGEIGRIFEVTATGQIVWDYVNPFVELNAPGLGGPPGGPAGDRGPPPLRGDRRGDRRHGRPRPHPPMPPGGPPFGPPGAPPGFGALRGGPPGGGMAGGGLFRASRLSLDHPGIQKVLEVARASNKLHN